jgi:hypothetical protein
MFRSLKDLTAIHNSELGQMISKRNIVIIFLFLLFLGYTTIISFSDTGTYTILDYSVKLTPRSDGTVEIEYYQKWLVTGGHIPWITIGMANSSYQIDQSKNRGNIRSIYAYNSSGWSGVRIDLDKDYLPDETFEAGFTLIQSKLFYADKDNYKLDFTPGWYDNAITERLTITMHIFAPMDSVKAYPEPTRIEGEEIIWEKLTLGKGGKFKVSISFPKTYMPLAQTNTLKAKEKTISKILSRLKFLIVLIPLASMILLALIINVIRATIRGIKYNKRRGLYFSASSFKSALKSSGGGGFGGRSSSCACACASCACACACAGGGGAGCSKKIHHTCSFCSGEERPPQQKTSKYNT